MRDIDLFLIGLALYPHEQLRLIVNRYICLPA